MAGIHQEFIRLISIWLEFIRNSSGICLSFCKTVVGLPVFLAWESSGQMESAGLGAYHPSFLRLSQLTLVLGSMAIGYFTLDIFFDTDMTVAS